MENDKPYKIFFTYLIIIIGTIANLMLWTDSRPGPAWLLFLAAVESLALLNFWFSRFISKSFWGESFQYSFWVVVSLLFLRLIFLPFAVAP